MRRLESTDSCKDKVRGTSGIKGSADPLAVMVQE